MTRDEDPLTVDGGLSGRVLEVSAFGVRHVTGVEGLLDVVQQFDLRRFGDSHELCELAAAVSPESLSDVSRG